MRDLTLSAFARSARAQVVIILKLNNNILLSQFFTICDNNGKALACEMLYLIFDCLIWQMKHCARCENMRNSSTNHHTSLSHSTLFCEWELFFIYSWRQKLRGNFSGLKKFFLSISLIRATREDKQKQLTNDYWNLIRKFVSNWKETFCRIFLSWKCASCCDCKCKAEKRRIFKGFHAICMIIHNSLWNVNFPSQTLFHQILFITILYQIIIQSSFVSKISARYFKSLVNLLK
jgi:hypothetical protein